MWSNKEIKRCCVVSETQKKEKRIKDCMAEHAVASCQFEKYRSENGFEELFDDKYEINQKYYCLLHLPLEREEKKLLSKESKKIFKNLLNRKVHKDFSYIQLEDCCLEIGLNHIYVFKGCFFNKISIKRFLAEEISIDYCLINQGLNFEESEVQRFYLKNSILDCYLNFKGKNKIKHCVISDNEIKLDSLKNGLVRHDSSHGSFIFSEGNYQNILFLRNKIACLLEFKKSAFVEKINFTKNTLHVCPEIDIEFNSTQDLILPKKEDFKIDKINTKEILQICHRRFNSIYKISKKTGNRNEIEDYYYLERKFYYLSKKSLFFDLLDLIFDFYDDHGTNLKRSVMFFLFIFLAPFFLSLADWLLWVVKNFSNNIDVMRHLEFGWVFKNAPSLNEIANGYFKPNNFLYAFLLPLVWRILYYWKKFD